MPKFSVVIPLYNKEAFVGETITSILKQTFADFELLIINDCSTDKSENIAVTFIDKRIKIIRHEHNQGLSASRNTGIKNSCGDFITFLDADDTWKPDFLESILKLTEMFPECAIFGTDYEEKIGAKTTTPKKNFPENCLPGTFFKVEDFFKAALFNPIYCYSCVAFSKNVFENIGDFDTSIDYGEDVDFNIRVHTVYSLAYYYKPCATYSMGIESQITDSGVKNKRLPNLKKYEALADKNPSLKDYINAKHYYYASQYKNQKDIENFERLMSEIDFNQLSWKQKLLLKSPYALYKAFKTFKKFLLQKGIKVTPY